MLKAQVLARPGDFREVVDSAHFLHAQRRALAGDSGGGGGGDECDGKGPVWGAT
jgi:hypothetical protein